LTVVPGAAPNDFHRIGDLLLCAMLNLFNFRVIGGGGLEIIWAAGNGVFSVLLFSGKDLTSSGSSGQPAIAGVGWQVEIVPFMIS
jgi:hypothetical protein